MFRSIGTSLITALVLVAPSAQAQLNGTYTIGTAGNYATFTAAVSALTTNGVNGPVVFNVFSGTYTEQLTIGAVAGASTVNTITFQSQALDSMAVVLEHPSQATNANDWTVRLNGVDHITFRKMTIQRSGNLDYGTVVTVMTGSNDFAFRNCRLVPSTATNTAQARPAFILFNNVIGASVIDRCAINYGSGLIASFTSSGSLSVTNNVLTNVLHGVSLTSTSAAIDILGNTITARNAGGSRGLLLNTVSGAVRIRNNRIQGSNNTYYGILFSSMSGTAATPIPIENNSIIATNCLAGISTTGGACNYLDFHHNSVCITGGTNPDAFNMVVGSGISNRISNNIFYSANGPGLRVSPASRVSASDNNVIRNGGVFGVYWGTTWYYDQPSLAAGSGRNLNSLFTDPLFVNNTSDLHLQPTSPCLGAGQVIATVLDDFDGEARPQPVATNPEIGADERPEQCSGMSGTYVIGSSGAADYPGFNAAINALTGCGITAPVLFEVESGTYTEQVSIPQINGTSATNNITFRSAAFDSTAVVLTWPSAATNANDFTVRLNGGDRIIFDRITIERSGADDYAQVVTFEGTDYTSGSQFNRFTRCRLRGSTLASPSTGYLIGTNMHALNDSVHVDHCRLENGSYGVYWNSFSLGEKVLVENNVFTGQQFIGARFTISGTHFTFRNNEVTLTAASAIGVSISGSVNAIFMVHGNRMNTVATALSISGSGSAGSQPRVYNNMLRSSAGSGMVITAGANSLWFDHNSIDAALYGVHFQSGSISCSSFRNNAIRSANYTVYRQSSSTFLSLSGFNALYRTTAGALAYWTAAQNTLPALQAASGGFASSTIADPRYYNVASADLHAYAMEVDMAGTPLVAITTDIDGDSRSLTTPDIGADEFAPQLWADAFNTCSAADPITSTGSGTDKWIYKDRKVVARFNDNGENLGTVQLNVYLNNGPVRTSDMGQHYLDRNWHVVTQNSISSSAGLRLFFSMAEFIPFAVADPLVTVLGDAGVAHYAGTNENCLETDNPGGQTWTGMYPVTAGTEARIAASGGASYVTASIDSDGELYVTGQGQVLPVELNAFRAERLGEREVRLDWVTATEHDNAGFEVWRMIEGEADFEQVGWVDGAGNSQHPINYMHNDDNAATRTGYYKLKQVDADGQYQWSPVVAVVGAGSTTELVPYPNPAKDVIMLVGLAENTTSITLHDTSGRVVRQWNKTELIDGLGTLERGVYLLSAVDGAGGKQSVRVVLE